MQRERYFAVGGLNEADFAVAFNDVDFCLRLNQKGWQSLYEPRSTLIHHASVSRGLDRDPVGAARLASELAALDRFWRTSEIMAEVEHKDRYGRAHEFYDVVTGLWDSWADDAFVYNVDEGLLFDPEKLHILIHQGAEFSVRGPLNIGRPVQGWPVIFQAGASEEGRQLAAETADVIFGSEGSLEGGKRFYADIHQRLSALGRASDSLKIMPGALVFVGETLAEAQAKRAHLNSLVHDDICIPALSRALGYDASGFDPDGLLPEVPPTNDSKSTREFVIALAQQEQLTVRELAQRFGGYGGLTFVGTATSIADEMELWQQEHAADGFTIMFPYVPEGIDDFVDTVVPELQRRNLFRTEYEGETLRENLGLVRPENQFFPT